ncbi:MULTISPECIES: YggT family protein [Actinomyces]|uniref:YggT family protein n=1 Tax=Actinomyces respiraculi TaxID=2744574 RepID=A0A7T0PXX6_9ACTO|nr:MULTISPECIES: YggT family protein [Actinomyces]QPL06275.1 YggT family protein [Actinomyces respiraculi]
MSALAAIILILRSLLSLYLLVLLGRVVLDWVQMLARQWRPTGVVLILANLVYALTDPPLRALRRVVPAVHLGGVGIDMSFLALYVGIILFQGLLGLVARLG